MTTRVYLVLDADRHVLDMCADEPTAAAFAHAMDGTVESWPVMKAPRMVAWQQAVLASREAAEAILKANR